MAVDSPAALPAPVPTVAAGIGRWSMVLAASVAGLALAAAGMRAGWPMVITTLALSVHGGLAATGAWHLRLARQAHRQLLHSVSTLRADQSALRVSAAEVAHDMRAPIVTICSYLELLIDGSFGSLPDAAREAAEQAARASSRARSLVEQTLAVHAAGSRAMMAAEAAPCLGDAPATVDLAAVMRDVTASLAADIAATRARIEVGPLPCLAGAEAAYFRIFENLIQNAIRYRKPGTDPRIVVTAHAAVGATELAVSDDGVGILPAERERVFARHARGSGEPTPEGHGLGLATVRDLVTALGGSVWIDPQVVDGTCVRVRIRG